MSDFSPDDFEELLSMVRASISKFASCRNIRSIESNFNTKGMVFNSKNSPSMNGTIIVGQDNGYIAVDISLDNGEVISFNLKDENDQEGLMRIREWFRHSYINRGVL